MRSDEDIKKDVIDALYWDDRVDASKVAVEVEDGVVTLTGTVPTYRSWTAAGEDAQVITGVADVENLILVSYAVLRTLPDDAELLARTTEQLERDPDVDASGLLVSVRDGWVTVEGSVPSYWQKEIAEQVAASGLGVLGVTNELAVVPAADVEDELIADDLVKAIERTTAVDVEDVDVEVVGGLVTLRGTVPSWHARNVAVDIARHTSGVVGVEDKMLVGSSAAAR